MLGQVAFLRGFNQDIAFEKLSPGMYYSAKNMRLVTSDGGTSGDLENIKGNLYKVEYPNVGDVLRVTLDVGVSNDLLEWELSYDGHTATFNTRAQYQDMADAINNDPILTQGKGLIAYVQTSDVLYREDGLSITSTRGTRIAGSLILTITAGSKQFVDSLGTTANPLTPAAFIRSASNLRTIGWINMRDDIILWSTDSEDEEPNGTTGQLWRLSYDKKTLDCTMTLLYHNILDFSTANPIATPGMVVARYETPDIQRVYWTDNYNVPRTCNVADPDLFSKDPTLLALGPTVSPYVPIPQNILQAGGSLKTGSHQIAYRLNSADGGQTAWFLPSYPLVVVDKPESTPILDLDYDNTNSLWQYNQIGYDGGPAGLTPTDQGHADIIGGKTTGKAIRYNIGLVDTNYDTVEIAHIYRANLNDTPEINIIAEEPVNGSSFSYTLTGDENQVPITEEEFNAANQAFNRVGTINTKDDYLFLGDVELRRLDIGDYDTRAYRFNGNQLAKVLSSDGTSTTIDGSLATIPWTSVLPEHDAICANDSPIPDGALNLPANYLYQSDGTTLGGEGPNISYEFITESVRADDHNPHNSDSNASHPPYYRVSPSYTSTTNINSSTPHVQEFLSESTFPGYRSPYIAGFLRGYQRDEVYRFAIVFYDEQGNPGWANWIADIRFPHQWMPASPTSYQGHDRDLDYPVMTDSSLTTGVHVSPNEKILADLNILGIRFTINNLDTLPDDVSGYSIVRVKREDNNMSIIGQGLWHPCIYDTTANFVNHLTFADHSTLFADAGYLPAGRLEPSTIGSMFLCPDWFNTDKLANTGFQTGDTIDVIGMLHTVMDDPTENQSGVAHSSTELTKNYDSEATTVGPITNNQATNTAARTPFTITGTVVADSWNNDKDANYFAGGLDFVNASKQKGSAIGGDNGTGENWEGVKCLAIAHEDDMADQGVAGTQLHGWDSSWGINAYGADNFDQFYVHGTGAAGANTRSIYTANYKRSFTTASSPVNTQYGSNTYQGRSNSVYISTNHYQKIEKGVATYTNDVYGGDTFVFIYDNLRNTEDRGTAGAGSGCTFKFFPLESPFNWTMRQPTDGSYSAISGPEIPNKLIYEYTIHDQPQEQYKTQAIFTVQNDIKQFIPQPVPYIETNIYDTRIYNNSNPKVNGELYDQWRIIKSEDYIQADTEHGRVTSLINHQDRLMFLQERAVGVVDVNEQSIVQDASGSSIILGQGGVAERIGYLSTRVGSWHKFGIAQGPYSFIFFDLMSKKFYTVGQNIKAVSDIAGLSGFLDRFIKGNLLDSDNPVRGNFISTYPAGITSTYDYRYNEFLITVHDSIDPIYGEVRTNLVQEGTFDNVTTALGVELIQDIALTPTYTGANATGTTAVDYFDLNISGDVTAIQALPDSTETENIWWVDQKGGSNSVTWDYTGAGRAEVAGAGTFFTDYGTLQYNANSSDATYRLLQGRDYVIQFDATVTTGEFDVSVLNDPIPIATITSTATYTYNVTANKTTPNLNAIVFQTDFGQNGFRGNVDNVSIKEQTYVLGGGTVWTPVGDWSFKGNKAIKNTKGAIATLTQTIANHPNPLPAPGSSYRLKFTITGSNGGSDGISLRVFGTGVTPTITANGTYEYFFDPAFSNSDLVVTAGANWLGAISNIELWENTKVDDGEYRAFTVAYNEQLNEGRGSFTSFYSLTPPMWINNKRNIITPYWNLGDKFYFWDEGLFGSFNGTVYPSEVTSVLNAAPQIEKMFSNVILNTKVYDVDNSTPTYEPIIADVRETFDRFMAYNQYQNTGERDIDGTNSRFIKRKWNISLGGNRLVDQSDPNFVSVIDGPFENKAYTERLKSNYAFLKFIYDNDNNRKIVAEGFLYKYMNNPTHGYEEPTGQN